MNSNLNRKINYYNDLYFKLDTNFVYIVHEPVRQMNNNKVNYLKKLVKYFNKITAWWYILYILDRTTHSKGINEFLS